MSYLEGFLLAVPATNKEAYRQQAAKALPLFKELGARRFVETWGDDVPDGKATDFKRAVKAKADEIVVFSWIEYASKEARVAANDKLMTDERMKAMMTTPMPFDAERMIFGGFATLLDEGSRAKVGYVDGYLLAVPTAKKDAYRELAAKAATVFRDHGATRVVEAWGDDLREGKVTDFQRAVQATADESIVFSWIEWPSKEVRDAGMKKTFEDERMKPDEAKLFDGKRMIFGGFVPLLDE
ncbi:MAG: DUF1428 domain-containing protein [Polyangiaceae bacterium]|nr:DUF1428 domain-containing protein [Polyangiaceae bacterium]